LLASMINNEFCSDVHLILGGHTFYAHTVLLASASTLFQRLLQYVVNQHPSDNTASPLSWEEVRDNKIAPFKNIERIETEADEGRQTVRYTIEIDEDLVTNVAMKRILEYLYSGMATIADRNDKIEETRTAAQLFECEHLLSIIDNVVSGDVELNPSIATWLNDTVAERIKGMFMNQNNSFSDVHFVIPSPALNDQSEYSNGGAIKFYGHRSLLSCQCPVMSAMLNNGFTESEQREIVMDVEMISSPEAYTALFEYMYTAHAPINDANVVSLMILANQYGLTRLVTLCELYITKLIEKATIDGIANADIDIIGLMLCAQTHNAPQLAQFCLHFISTNYQPMSKRAEFALLEGDNLAYIEANQWPPKSYLEAMLEYEKEISGASSSSDTNKQCSIM